MKTTRLNKITRLAMALAMFAGTSGMVIAGETSIKGNVAQVIQLHAPNNAAQTVTIWTSKTTLRSAGKIATARDQVPQVIKLHAPNSPVQSVTLWTGSPEKNIDLAPLK